MASTGMVGPDDPGRRAIAQWHRGFALLAVISLFVGTRALWTEALPTRPALAFVITACYAAILLGAVLVTTVSSPRLMTVVEAAILGTAIVLVVCLFIVHHKVNDEGALVARAADTILHGSSPYGVHWPDVFDDAGIAPTKTMGGGQIDIYPYPPLAALLTAVVQLAVPGYVSAGLASTLALIAGAVLLWLLLPAPWRSAGTAVVLGFDLLAVYGHRGYPAVIAMALLIPVAVGWTSIGQGGRLARRDVLRAICLGAACATQQLAWFLVPFLLLGIWSLRRGDLPARAAARVVGGFMGIGAVIFLVVNLPFIVSGPSAWLAGVLSPLLDHAVPHGQGLVGISYYLLDGSSQLAFYSYAALLFGLALLALSLLFMRRLGPAMFILPWMIFFLATRSQDGYYLMMTPLWLASLATVSLATFSNGWQPRVGVLRSPPVRVTIAALLFVPAVACIMIAVVSAPPLRMQVLGTGTVEGKSGIAQIDVQVTNTGSTPLRPHFAVSKGQSMSKYWLQQTGPDALGPGQTADIRLLAAGNGALPGPGGYFKLRAVTDDPMTLSSTDIPAPD
jgi:hypothetical protein